MTKLNAKTAQALVEAVCDQANGIKKPVTVVVSDAAGFAIALHRMDGARPLTTRIASAKAYTCVVMQRPTILLGKLLKEKPEFFAQLSTMAGQPILAEAGGTPLYKDGEIVGGIGVSGASGEEDQQFADNAARLQGFEVESAAWNKAPQ